MSTAADVLRSKRAGVHVIPRDCSAYQAAARMVALGIGSLLVVDVDRRPCGFCNERNYLEGIVLAGRDPHTTTVAHIMSSEVYRVRPETSTEECMRMMTRHRVRHLTVGDGGRILGILSQGDVTKYLVTDRSREVRQLTEYIQGRYPA